MPQSLLQVKISSPLLVLPQYWSSTKVLLLDLQSLEIKNMFRLNFFIFYFNPPSIIDYSSGPG